MEFCEHGDLLDHILEGLPELDTAVIMVQVARAVRCMHEHGFIHRDLKPGNIFVVTEYPIWHVKVGDFGTVTKIQMTTPDWPRVGTKGYMAPEVYQDTCIHTAAVDMWSLGAVAFHLLTGRLPRKDNYTPFPVWPLNDKGSSQRCIAFIRVTMARRPEDRLTAQEALDHAWLAGFGDEVDDLYERSNAYHASLLACRRRHWP
ncbi:kinase-like domain-containing protein [Hypoxylon sp. FL1857]|nr:kinase-like domain-containing protein [Hypoxylon sp. FL1857]